MGRGKIIIGTEGDTVKSIKRTYERVFSPKKLSPKKLLEVYKWINKNFFSIKNILRYQLRYILAFFVNIHHRVYAIKDEALLIL